MSASSCPTSSLVTRHFERGLAPADERTMRLHLPGCAACTRRYQCRLVLARLDPSAASAEDRLARGLGLGERQRSAWSWRGVPAWATAALATVLVLLVARAALRALAEPADMTARGGGAIAAPAAQLRVYRVGQGVPAQLVDGVVHAGDELAIAYTNPQAQKQLMVFATDELGQVYWYVPAWTDATTDPGSRAIAPTPELVEVPDAVTHAWRGHHLTLHAMFTDEPFTVRQIETMLALDPAALARLGRPHLQLPLEVAP